MARLAINGGDPVRSRPFTAWPVFGREEEDGLISVLRSGHWGRLTGGEAARFETRFAAEHGASHGVAVVTGTTALRIALLASGIEAGDEVIVPPYTFLATATAVVEANGVPVFADIDETTFSLDPAAVEAAITPRTRAVIPVHLGGLPADMDAINALARKHDLVVIEDACHAHGARYRGRPVGSLGNMACFSFQATKNMTSGEGGIILSRDDGLAAQCVSIHNCGRVPEGAWYEHHTISGNFRMTEFQGAVLNAQLDRLGAQSETRWQNGRWLAAFLEDVPGITPQGPIEEGTRHAHHLFPFRYDAAVYGVPRQRYLDALCAEGVPVGGGYETPLYRQPVFVNRAFGPYTGWQSSRPDLDYTRVSCPVCERISGEEGAWFDQHVLLGSAEDLRDVADAFQKVHEYRGELASDDA